MKQLLQLPGKVKCTKDKQDEEALNTDLWSTQHD